MPDDSLTVLATDEINQRLADGGTGVLSVAKNDTPYSIPVSFGYDPETSQLFFRLGFTPESDKHEFITDGTDARLVLYENTGGVWRSIIVTGSLHELTPADIDNRVARNLRRATPPLYSIWDAPTDSIEFRIYELQLTSISGRESSQ
jgi:nitroimidazol reductase NimA-like FMN-containing flavoprotein (pyridoxamine 5'-phosphate oxidase superfamily)